MTVYRKTFRWTMISVLTWNAFAEVAPSQSSSESCYATESVQELGVTSLNAGPFPSLSLRIDAAQHASTDASVTTTPCASKAIARPSKGPIADPRTNTGTARQMTSSTSRQTHAISTVFITLRSETQAIASPILGTTNVTSTPPSRSRQREPRNRRHGYATKEKVRNISGSDPASSSSKRPRH